MPLLTVAKGSNWELADVGDETFRLIAEYSKTGRARCRKCSSNIAKGELRIGVPIKWRAWISSWVHVDCFWAERGESDDPDEEDLLPYEDADVFGFDSLEEEDKPRLRAALKRTSPPEHLKAVDPNDPEFVKKKDLPKLPTPDQMAVTLLPFQQEGLGWLLGQEQGEVGGGILADQMGMGKTIQTIALLVASKYGISAGGKKRKATTRHKGPTLVVCPSSAMLQWYDEIKRCTLDDSLSVLVFHSSNRHKLTPADIMKHDVVLTSYPVLEYDYRSQVNRQKVVCEYCGRKFLPRKLAPHHKYFCGPESVRSERLQKRERKQDAATRKAMVTLNITQDPSNINVSKKSQSGESFPTPSQIYRELMKSADRTPVPMYVSAKKALQQANGEVIDVDADEPSSSKSDTVVLPVNGDDSSSVEEVPPRRTSTRKSASMARNKIQKLHVVDGDDIDEACKAESDDSDAVLYMGSSQDVKAEEATDEKGRVVYNGDEDQKEASAWCINTLWCSRSSNHKQDRVVVFWRKTPTPSEIKNNQKPTWLCNASLFGPIDQLTTFAEVFRSPSSVVLAPKKVPKQHPKFWIKLGATLECSADGLSYVTQVEGFWAGATDRTPAPRGKSVSPVWDMPEDMVAEGWVTSMNEHIGKVVVRSFDRRLVLGVVVAFCPELGIEDPAMWHVRHIDGDEEDLESDELKKALRSTRILKQFVESCETDARGEDSDSDFEGESDNMPSLRLAIEKLTGVREDVEQAKEGDTAVKKKRGPVAKKKRGLASKQAKKEDGSNAKQELAKSRSTRAKRPSSTQVVQGGGSDDSDFVVDGSGSDSDSDNDEPKASKNPTSNGAAGFDEKLLLPSFAPATWGSDDKPSDLDDPEDHTELEVASPPLKKKRVVGKQGKGTKKGDKGTKKGGEETDKRGSGKGTGKKAKTDKGTNKETSKKAKTGKGNPAPGDSSESDSDSSDDGRIWAMRATRGLGKVSKKASNNRRYAGAGCVVDDDGIDVGRSLLHVIAWERVVLDEAHKIKDRVNSTAKSVFALRGHPDRQGPGSGSGGGACNRWCLTGTPLQNRVGELYSLIRFLRVDPYAFYFCKMEGCDCRTLHWSFGGAGRVCVDCGHPPMKHFSYFNKTIINPIKRTGYTGDGRTAMLLLQNDLLGKVMLRRTKEERAQDINLPPLGIEIAKVKMGEEERDFYESVYKNTRSRFDTYVKKGTLMHNYAHIFELLSRLRQAVDHPYLVIHGNASASQDKGYDPTVTSSARQSDVCGICFFDIDDLKKCAVSHCRHTFHKACIEEYIAGGGEDEGGDAGDSLTDLANNATATKKKKKAAAKPKKRKASDYNSIDKESPQSKTCPVCFVPLSVTIGIHGHHNNKEDEVLGEDDRLCVVCLDNPRNALLLPCGHVHMCCDCAQSLEKKTCPVCRGKFNKVVKMGSDAAEEGQVAKAVPLIGRRSILQRINMDEFASSSKTDAVVNRVLDMVRANKKLESGSLNNKAIIFSQYNNMLDIVEWKLKNSHIHTVKLVGSMPMQARRAVLAAFKGQTKPEVNVILMSLKAGGEGLNLQEASHVFVLEPWWNPAVEMQAIQRAHRIGQTRAVTAVRFCVEDSIEERMLDLQDKKKLVFEGTVDGSKAALAQLTEQDLKFLFSRG